MLSPVQDILFRNLNSIVPTGIEIYRHFFYYHLGKLRGQQSVRANHMYRHRQWYQHKCPCRNPL